MHQEKMVCQYIVATAPKGIALYLLNLVKRNMGENVLS